MGSAAFHPWNRTNDDGTRAEVNRSLHIPTGRPLLLLEIFPETNALPARVDRAGLKSLRNRPLPGLPHVFHVCLAATLALIPALS